MYQLFNLLIEFLTKSTFLQEIPLINISKLFRITGRIIKPKTRIFFQTHHV